MVVVVVVVVVVSVRHQFPAIAASPAAVVLHRRVRSSFVFSTQAPTRTSVRSGLPFRPLGPLRQRGSLDDRGRTPTPWLNCAPRTELGTVRANDGNSNWELPRNKTASQNNKLYTSIIVIILLLLLLLCIVLIYIIYVIALLLENFAKFSISQNWGGGKKKKPWLGWSWLLLSIDNCSTFLGSALGCQIIILFCKFQFGNKKITYEKLARNIGNNLVGQWTSNILRHSMIFSIASFLQKWG
jgi:hypothetical protein